ncbi:hypothetical protein CC2G_004505 [Coprinopsis cinerea AmutBmut pab1-1]|nr:hypothetical protein CC2G_004505 [Coprinopsis cinerea AmutBmut pab1-1]
MLDTGVCSSYRLQWLSIEYCAAGLNNVDVQLYCFPSHFSAKYLPINAVNPRVTKWSGKTWCARKRYEKTGGQSHNGIVQWRIAIELAKHLWDRNFGTNGARDLIACTANGAHLHTLP